MDRADAPIGPGRSEPVGSSERVSSGASLGELVGRLRRFGRRRRGPNTVVGSVATAAALMWLLSGRRHEFVDALSSAEAWVLAATVLLQIGALVSRSEAWHLTIQAAGGTVARRVLYRASSMQVLGSVINGQLGVAARIAALRHSSPDTQAQSVASFSPAQIIAYPTPTVTPGPVPTPTVTPNPTRPCA